MVRSLHDQKILDAANDERLTVGEEAGLPPKVAWPWSTKVCSGVSREFGVIQGNKAIYLELGRGSGL
jgi:hypothetical protein